MAARAAGIDGKIAAMDGGYGIESPAAHAPGPHRQPVRYLILIDAGGSAVARLFIASREPAGEFDAGSEEVAVMTKGLVPVTGALGTEWDKALEGHSAAERGAAEVYTLDV